MKHQNPQELAGTVTSYPMPQTPRMSRRERVERWASLLECHGGRLNALREIEFLPPEKRRAYRDANTPLTIAYNDQVLRDEGLRSDGLGDAMDFFGMSDSDAHRLLCDCGYLGTMTGDGVARRLRHYAAKGEFRGKVRRVIGRIFGHAV